MTHALALALSASQSVASPASPASPAQKHTGHRGQSTIATPVQVVWAIVRANPTLSRNLQLELAELAGVAYYTARTQIQECRKFDRIAAAEAAAQKDNAVVGG